MLNYVLFVWVGDSVGEYTARDQGDVTRGYKGFISDFKRVVRGA